MRCQSHDYVPPVAAIDTKVEPPGFKIELLIGPLDTLASDENTCIDKVPELIAQSYGELFVVNDCSNLDVPQLCGLGKVCRRNERDSPVNHNALCVEA